MKKTQILVVIMTFAFVLNLGGAWDNDDYDSRQTVSFDSTYIDSDLTNFTSYLYVNLTDIPTDYECKEFAFYNETTGTELDFEVENANATACDIWIQTNYLEASTNATAYIYYDNNTAIGDNSDGEGTWDTDIWAAVYHLNDDFLDSTSNSNDGTNSGSDDDTGKIADGQDFVEGNSDYINIGDITLNSFSILSWSSFTGVTGTFNSILGRYDVGTSSNREFFFRKDSNEKLELGVYQSDTTDVSSVSTTSVGSSLAFYAGTWDDSTSTTAVYVNGTQEDTDTGSITKVDSTLDICIGCLDDGNTQYWDGKQDEVRIAKIALSDDWIKAEYYSQTGQLSSYSNPNFSLTINSPTNTTINTVSMS